MSKTIKISKGSSGWGGPLLISPSAEKNKVMVITGGTIPRVAQIIAELTDTEIVDGFKHHVDENTVFCVVIDCGGSLRCGLYPKKKIPTINIAPSGPSGPMAEYITPELYVSDVSEKNIELVGEAQAVQNSYALKNTPEAGAEVRPQAVAASSNKKGGFEFIASAGQKVGKIVATLFQAGRDAINLVITNILPFMAFISAITGIILYTGFGKIVAKVVSPLATSFLGLLFLSLVLALPFLSPFIGPGGVIAQVLSAVIGTQIGLGNVAPVFALPVLFGIDSQMGCDFIPVGLSLQEAEFETVEVGVPAVLISRIVTGPIAVMIAFALSFGMY